MGVEAGGRSGGAPLARGRCRKGAVSAGRTRVDVRSRKHSWMREEVILALDLYLEKGMARRADWDELSALLRVWPVEEHLAEDPTFRNWQGVRNKLYNLQSLGTGGERGRPNAGRATEEVWAEFGRDRERVARAAGEIRTAVRDAIEARTPGREDEDDYVADESSVVVVTHRRRERNREIVHRKRRQVRETTGALACEACGFDFEARYGEAARDLIECHHLRPVSQLRPGERTRLEDLRVVCPNCHRLIHHRLPWLRWDELLQVLSR